MTPTVQEAADHTALLELNDVYIRSAEASDVSRFKDILAEDFHCARPDGSLVDKAQFLKHVSEAPRFAKLRAHDVQVQLLGDMAIVHARTTFTTLEGRAGSSRYTDVWARRQGRWRAVSAHVTRY